MSKRLELTYLLLAFVVYLPAQTMEVINEAPYTPQELIENVFLGEGVQLLGVQYDGDPRSAAYFKGGQQAVGIERGIVMTTGVSVTDGNIYGVHENGSRQASRDVDSPLTNDPDLRNIVGAGVNLNDITRYTITFRPLSDTISFRYVFASEEYPEYVCSQFNDVFGFFMSGPGIVGTINLAQIPNANLPVSINSVNSGMPGSNANGGTCSGSQESLAFNQYYRNNNGSNNQPVFDGISTVFTATMPVQACQTYTIKLVIADVGDSAFDSGVFLEARSFGGTATNLNIVNLAIDGTLREGCQGAELHFYTLQPVEEDLPLEVSIFGNATPGVDYTTLPSEFIIPAGDSLLVVPVSAFPDDIDDDGELIRISLRRSPCLVDTFDIRIEQSRIGTASLTDQVIICGGETVQLDGTLSNSEPERFTFTRSEDVVFGRLFTPATFTSTININGFVPNALSDGIIQSVCINDLENNRVRQISAFLIAPNGAQLELSSRNGGTVNNAPFSGYQNTCFSPTATNRIALPGQEAPATQLPFSGNWLPEGDFNELYFNNPITNGAWQLQLIDNAPLTDRTRFGDWSITLERPYQVFYQWQEEALLSCYDCPNPVLTAEQPGFVYMTATDSYGCEIRDSVEVVFPPNSFLEGVSCGVATDSTLSISWNTNVDALFYEVSTSDRNWIEVGTATSFTFQGLQFDSTYTFFVRGIFADCIGPVQRVSCTTLPCLTPPVISASSNDISCFGLTDGQISLSAEGGSAPFRFLLNGQPFAGGSQSDLPPNDYEAIVFNARGCSDTLLITLSEPARLDASISQTGAVNCGSSASLSAAVNGGTAPYTYTWNGNTGAATLSDINQAGTYNLLVTDANGCTFADEFTITAPPPLLANHNATPETCSGTTDGSISIEAAGGSPPLSYNWSEAGIGDTNSASGLSSGNYQITVTDVAGCEFLVEAIVGRGPDVLLEVARAGASCFGSSNGSISLEVSQATAPISYSWTGSNSNTNQANNLAAGLYSVTITDGRGCQADSSILITEPLQLLGQGSSNNVLCFGENTGSILWTINGGTPPYNYSWSNGATTPDPGPLPAGTYQLVLTDANACVYTQDFLIEQNEALRASFQTQAASCAGSSDGAIRVQASNGTPPYSFSWPGQNSNGASLNNIPAGTYEIRLTDANGCSQSLSGQVSEPPAIVAEAVLENVRCHGERSGLIEIDVSGGTPGYQFQLGNSEQWSSSNVFLGLREGIYNARVRDAQGCLYLLEGLDIQQPAPLSVSLGERPSIRWGDSLELAPDISGGTLPIVSYRWIPSSNSDSLRFSCLNCPNPWFSPNNQSSIRLEIIDQAGCLASDQLTVLVEKDFPVLVPTGFTPNGDRNNDRLLVHGLPGIVVESFQVIDRWGELVYMAEDFPINDEAVGWDGTFRGEPLNAGVYLWQARVRFPDGNTERLAGQTTLLR